MKFLLNVSVHRINTQFDFYFKPNNKTLFSYNYESKERRNKTTQSIN